MIKIGISQTAALLAGIIIGSQLAGAATNSTATTAGAVTTAGAGDGAQIVLVRDGRNQCTIVTGKDDNSAQVYTMSRDNLTMSLPARVLNAAASDLADTLAEMTGIWDPAKQALVVATIGEARTPNRILLGTAAIEAYGLQAEAAALPYPAYVYRAISNDLLIFGSSSKGTANGVYGFMQDELGVRWFGPQELFRVMPRQTNIVVGALDKKVVPSFLGRLFHVEGRIEFPSYSWRRRMRMPEPIDDHEPFINASHNMWKIFPAAQYCTNHPEYYAMRSGRRANASADLSWNICYSNTNVVEIAAAAALSYFRGDARRQSFSLGINDCMAYCECEACAKLQPARTFQGQRVASDMYFHFVNEVARRVGKEFPDRYLGVIAYNDVTAPPVGGVESNVHVLIVNDVSEYYDAAYRAKDEELVKAWQAKGITLGFYYYTGLAKLVPAYFPRMLADVLKDKHRRGFTSLTSEVNPGWPWTGPMAYVQARLWWDINLDTDKLLDEYFESLFGPAADPMRKLYALFEEIHRRPRGGGFLYEHYKYQQFRPYTAADLAQMRALLAAAHAAIPGLGTGNGGHDGKQGQRVAYVSNGLKVFLDMLEGKVLTERLAADQAELDDIAAMDRLTAIEQLTTVVNRHTTLYRETILADPYQSGRYLNDTCVSVRQEWKNQAADRIGRALADLQQRSGVSQNITKARIERTVAGYCKNPLNKAVFMTRTDQVEYGPNLVQNPDFEEVWGEGAYTNCTAEQKDIAHGWNSTPHVRESGGSIDTLKYAQLDERFGLRSGRMHKVGASAYYLSNAFSVKPGQVYWCQADARLNLPEARGEMKPRVFLMVRWFGKGWIHSADYVAELGTFNEWQRLETAAIPPADAKSGSVWLCVENLLGEEEVLFDNVSARLITTR